MKNKKAWLRIVEVSVAVILFLGVLLIFVGQYDSQKISEEIYIVQEGILREIQINDGFRNTILSTEDSELPVTDFTGEYEKIKQRIDGELPQYLECDEMICNPKSECKKDFDSSKSIYADSIVISTNLTEFKPRRVKLFCWTERSD